MTSDKGHRDESVVVAIKTITSSCSAVNSKRHQIQHDSNLYLYRAIFEVSSLLGREAVALRASERSRFADEQPGGNFPLSRAARSPRSSLGETFP
jgi:hypothetical protein